MCENNLFSHLLEILPAPIIEVNEGDSVKLTCGPLPLDQLRLTANGVTVDVPVINLDGVRTYQLGIADRRNDSTVFQCISANLQSANTTLVVYCEFNDGLTDNWSELAG